MKKQIQTKKVDTKVYSTIKKLSLAMTIIGWVAFGIAIIALVAMFIIPTGSKKPDPYLELRNSVMWTLYGSLALMFLQLFLTIGQIILSKKVNNVTPKITGKQSLVVNIVALVVGAVSFLIIILVVFDVIDINGEVAEATVWPLGVLALLSYLMETIMSTIIFAQIKVNKPVKKGK